MFGIPGKIKSFRKFCEPHLKLKSLFSNLFYINLTQISGRPSDKTTAADVGIVLSLYGYFIDVSEQKKPRVNGMAIKCEITVITSTKNRLNLKFLIENKSIYIL